MAFSSLLGQPRASALLGTALVRGRPHHAYLFAGPTGSGKTLAAKLLAQALNCESPKASDAAAHGRYVDDPCGECASCRRISDDPKHNAHPLVMWVDTEQEMVRSGLYSSSGDRTPARMIGVRLIRELVIPRLSLTAVGGRRKVCILRDVDFNEAAQNAFLKTLEEPPPDTTFIILSSSPDLLKVTIRSRCLRVAFQPLSPDVIAERVAREKKVPLEEGRLLGALSGGNLGGALKADAKAIARRRTLIETVERLGEQDWVEWLGLAEALGDRDKALEALDVLESWLHDVLRVANGASVATNLDLAELAAQAATRVTTRELLRRVDLVREVRRAIDGNAQPRLQLERLVLGFCGIGALTLSEGPRGR